MAATIDSIHSANKNIDDKKLMGFVSTVKSRRLA